MSIGMTMWNRNMKKKKKLCYMDTDSFTEYIQIDEIYKDIAEDAKKGLKLQIMSWKGHNQKLIRVMKIELGWKIMTEFVGLRAKTYVEDGSEGKKQKAQKSMS